MEDVIQDTEVARGEEEAIKAKADTVVAVSEPASVM